MRQYSIAKVAEKNFLGLGSRISELTTVKAHNYDDAVERAIKRLRLKVGDTLSIIALQGSMPQVKGLMLPTRYEYKI